MDTHIEVQYQRYLSDRQMYGDHQEGVYRGFKWIAERRRDVYWCGYVECNDNLSDTEEGVLDEIAHYGITGGLSRDDDTFVGFDCAHHCDFFSLRSLSDNSIYKDFEFVQACLFRMIDFLVKCTLDKSLKHRLSNPVPDCVVHAHFIYQNPICQQPTISYSLLNGLRT